MLEPLRCWSSSGCRRARCGVHTRSRAAPRLYREPTCCRMGATARSVNPSGAGGWSHSGPVRTGVRPGRDASAASRSGAVPRTIAQSSVGLRLQSGVERRRGLRPIPTPQVWCRLPVGQLTVAPTDRDGLEVILTGPHRGSQRDTEPGDRDAESRYLPCALPRHLSLPSVSYRAFRFGRHGEVTRRSR